MESSIILLIFQTKINEQQSLQHVTRETQVKQPQHIENYFALGNNVVLKQFYGGNTK